MNKSKLNFIINAIMFALMAVIAGLGLLMKYVLLPGTERWVKYGRSVDLTFWGFDRHDWGKIHLILAISLIVLLALHIILHWNVIICWHKRFFKNKRTRVLVGICFVIITILFIVFPFMIQVDVEETLSGRERYYSSSEAVISVEKETKTTKEQGTVKENLQVEKTIKETEQHEKYDRQNQIDQNDQHARHEHHDIDPSIEVKGYMTLSQITSKYNIPEDYLKRKLKLPSSVSGSDQLGHLRKQYGFKMSEIEMIISNYKK